MSNILCQIRGTKRLILFPPEDIMKLQIEAGRSSSDLNVFDATAFLEEPLVGTTPYEVTLHPGDVLFIPAFWCHAASPTDGMSIAINMFFRELDKKFYASKDTFGNKDVPAYKETRKNICDAMGRLEEMPKSMSNFYLLRLAKELIDRTKDQT